MVHFCYGDCCQGVPTLVCFEQHVVPSLIPHACPMFPRSRWARADLAVNWCGLLANIHSLLKVVVKPWLREMADHARPVCAADFPAIMPEDSDSELERGGADAEDAAAVGDGDAVYLEMIRVEEVSGAASIDWATLNQATRKQAHSFMDIQNLETKLMMLRRCMQPHCQLMFKFLKMTGCKVVKGSVRVADDIAYISTHMPLLASARGVCSDCAFCT